MTPEYKPIEKGIVVREVINPRPISEFPETVRRDMHLRYTVKQMIQEGYTDMSFVELNTVIKYELVPEEGFDNLYDAYVDWWNRNVPQREEVSWNGEVLKVPSSWKPQPFYPINPIEEKENTMQFKISRNQISNQIKKIEESLKNQKTRIISELNSIEEKISNGEPISGNLKEYHMYDLILRQLNYLKSFENVVEIICSEEEKDKIFKEIPCSSDEE